MKINLNEISKFYKYNLLLTFILTFFVMFSIAHGASFADSNTIEGATSNIKSLIKTLTGIAYALVFLAFFWGLAKYLLTFSDDKKKESMKLMVTSIAVIFVMTSIWGIVALIQGTLGISGITGKTIRVPKVQLNR